MLEGFELHCVGIESNNDLSVERLNPTISSSVMSLGPDNLNGIDFTRMMREKGCTIPVLLVSAHFPVDAMKWEQSDSVTLRIRKPLEYSLLVAALAKLFELHTENGPLEFSRDDRVLLEFLLLHLSNGDFRIIDCSHHPESQQSIGNV